MSEAVVAEINRNRTMRRIVGWTISILVILWVLYALLSPAM